MKSNQGSLNNYSLNGILGKKNESGALRSEGREFVKNKESLGEYIIPLYCSINFSKTNNFDQGRLDFRGWP